jgi:hypothetical protein
MDVYINCPPPVRLHDMKLVHLVCWWVLGSVLVLRTRWNSLEPTRGLRFPWLLPQFPCRLTCSGTPALYLHCIRKFRDWVLACKSGSLSSSQFHYRIAHIFGRDSSVDSASTGLCRSLGRFLLNKLNWRNSISFYPLRECTLATRRISALRFIHSAYMHHLLLISSTTRSPFWVQCFDNNRQLQHLCVYWEAYPEFGS